MSYKRSVTSSHASDDIVGLDESVSWPSGCSSKCEWVWDSAGRARRLADTWSDSDMDEESQGQHSEQDCEHARRMKGVNRRLHMRVRDLEQRLIQKDNQEATSQDIQDSLAERVATLTCKYCALRLDLEGARVFIRKLKMILGVILVAFIYSMIK